MLTDAHCHPADLAGLFPDAEKQRRQLGVMCAASSTTAEEFALCERLSHESRDEAAAPLLPCFAAHPQQIAYNKKTPHNEAHLPNISEQLAALETLAAEGKIAAVGETGFDLYNTAYRETEKEQEALFEGHLKIALRHSLPLIMHVRRAMHKVFACSSALKQCRAVVFHSCPCTAGEGEALLRRGINAFFSFGNAIVLNHREAMRCCAVFPASRLLTETDAPFQPFRGDQFSCYADLTRILEAAAALRREAGTEGSCAKELEGIVERNFRTVFL